MEFYEAFRTVLYNMTDTFKLPKRKLKRALKEPCGELVVFGFLTFMHQM